MRARWTAAPLALLAAGCYDRISLGGAGWRCTTNAECPPELPCVATTPTLRTCGGSCVPDPTCPPGALACDGLATGGKDQFDGWEHVLARLDGSPLPAGRVASLRRVERHDCDTTPLAAIEAAGDTRAMLRLGTPRLTELFLRAHFFVPSTAPTAANVALVTIDVGGDRTDVGLDDERAGTLYIDPPSGDPRKMGTLPRGRWFCLEVAARLGSSEGAASVQAYVDGAPLAASTAATHRPAANLERLGVLFGLGVGPDQKTPFSVYMDALAVATERIGCR